MDGSKKHTATCPSGQILTQLVPALHIYHTFITNKIFSCTKQFGKLVVQVCAVGYQHNRRAGKLPATHQHPTKKQHSNALSTSGSSKVSTAFSITPFPKFGM